MDNIYFLKILRNDSTNEGNRVGETEGNCLSQRKIQVGKECLLSMQLASRLIALFCFNSYPSNVENTVS